MIEHRDHTGAVCTVHPAPSVELVLQLAAMGIELPQLLHDMSSKLQGLLMALDEILELELPQLALPTASATGALDGLRALIKAHRRPAQLPRPSRISLGLLAARAAERGNIKLSGDAPAADLEVVLGPATQALAIAMALVAPGPHPAVELSGTTRGDRVELVIARHGPLVATRPSDAGERFAIAASLIARDGGELRCDGTDQRVVVELAIARSAEAPSGVAST